MSDIEGLIATASGSKKDEDYQAFFEAIKGVELFFNVAHGSPSRGVATASATNPISIPLVTVGNNMAAVLFFTSRDNPGLKEPFGGIVWERALEMVIKMPDADGLVIQGKDTSWIAIDKARASILLHG